MDNKCINSQVARFHSVHGIFKIKDTNWWYSIWWIPFQNIAFIKYKKIQLYKLTKF